jgi:DNA-directed RNA polymerase specialized sigma24 family protein
MAISEDVLDRAIDSDRTAMEAMLADVYPSVFRLAHALTGRPGAARQVLHDVLRRSLRVAPKWRRGTVPENWYYHHTVITARTIAPTPPDLRDDVLVKQSGAEDPAYLAFIRALRLLPRQQAEAFLLHHGEKLNTRLLGVAMDCSHVAAGDHLRAADAALAAVIGAESTPAMTVTLERAYASLLPPPNSVRPSARKFVKAHLRPGIVKRVLLAVALLALVVAGYFAWRSRDALMKLLPERSAEPAATAPS